MGRTMVSMPAPISLDDAVRRLYDGPAADFVRVRKELAARAKSEGAADVARAITALRKPTVAAETVNHLEDQPLGELLAVGTALRAAQTRLDTDEMKRLTSERHRLLDAVLATVSVSPAVRDEVRCTLLAATADPSAEAAVASRTLVRGLRYSGWGEVDLSEGVLAFVSVPTFLATASAFCLKLALPDFLPCSRSSSASLPIEVDALLRSAALRESTALFQVELAETTFSFVSMQAARRAGVAPGLPAFVVALEVVTVGLASSLFALPQAAIVTASPRLAAVAGRMRRVRVKAWWCTVFLSSGPWFWPLGRSWVHRPRVTYRYIFVMFPRIRPAMTAAVQVAASNIGTWPTPSAST